MKLVCLIVEPVVVVAEDLALMIQELEPEAQVASATTLADALEVVARLGVVDLVFLGVPPERVAVSGLGSRLQRAGATSVYLGYEAEARAMGERFVEQPFLVDAIADEIRAARPGFPAGRGDAA